MAIQEFKPGRFFIGRIPLQADLLTAVYDLCREHSIECASFAINGVVLSATLGTYDQKQKVYVTAREAGPLDILSCSGNLINRENRFGIHADIVLSGLAGKTTGGRLFSPTTVLAGEVELTEFRGKLLDQFYDAETGLFLW